MMPRKAKLIITARDHQRLEKLLDEAIIHHYDNEELMALSEELKRAKIVESVMVPQDIVTMHSTIKVKNIETDTRQEFTLVYPGEADPDVGAISILSPIGTALFGHKIGDTIQWQVPAGLRKLLIEDILYQPEAAGEFHR